MPSLCLSGQRTRGMGHTGRSPLDTTVTSHHPRTGHGSWHHTMTPHYGPLARGAQSPSQGIRGAQGALGQGLLQEPCLLLSSSHLLPCEHHPLPLPVQPLISPGTDSKSCHRKQEDGHHYSMSAAGTQPAIAVTSTAAVSITWA